MLAILYRLQPFIIPFFIILTAWAIFVTVFKKDNAVGLVLYISLIIVVDWYLNTGIYIPGMAYGSIRYSEVFLVLMLAGVPEKTTRSAVGRFITLLVGLYFILLFYAALRGITLIDGLNSFRRYCVPQIATFWIAQRGFAKTTDYQRFFSCLIVLMIFIGLFTFWDVFFDTILLHSDSINTPDYYVNRRHGRFGSFFLNPNDFGAFSVLLLPIMLLTTGVQPTWLRRGIFWAGTLLFTFAFIKTQSRGAMIGFLASVMLFTLLPYRHFPVYRRAIAVVMVILLLGVFMPGFFETATRRFQDAEQESSVEEAGRASTWNHVVNKVIPSYPLFGIGLGEAQFIRIMEETGYADMFGRTFDNPHNSYLEIAVAAGCSALLVFLLLNVCVIATNISFIRTNVDKERGFLLLGLTSGIVGFLTATTTGQDMFRVAVAPVYWLVVGLCLSMTSKDSSASPAAASHDVSQPEFRPFGSRHDLREFRKPMGGVGTPHNGIAPRRSAGPLDR